MKPIKYRAGFVLPDEKEERYYESSTPFAAVSAGDQIHETSFWFRDKDGKPYRPGRMPPGADIFIVTAVIHYVTERDDEIVHEVRVHTCLPTTDEQNL